VENFYKKLEDEGSLLNEISSLGWAFWPHNKNGMYTGFFDSNLLRQLADELDRRNKPFWDEYDKYCLENLNDPEPEGVYFDNKITDCK
jgi:hypothetical protein